MDRTPIQFSGGHGVELLFSFRFCFCFCFLFLSHACVIVINSPFTFRFVSELKLTIFIHLSLLAMTWTELALAVCRNKNSPCSPWALVAADRAHTHCSWSHGLDSCWRFRLFVPRSSYSDKFTFHNWKIVEQVVNEMIKKVKKTSVFTDNSCCEWDK